VTVVSHDTTEAERFDETRVGLDHLSFDVADRPALDAWVAHFDALEVPHSGVIQAHFGRSRWRGSRGWSMSATASSANAVRTPRGPPRRRGLSLLSKDSC
jgi:hypothetical protein